MRIEQRLLEKIPRLNIKHLQHTTSTSEQA